MKIMLLVNILIALFLFNQQKPVKQGISGFIYLKVGNQMPSPERKPDNGKPVSCKIFIYQLTKRGQTTESGTHYTNIQTKLIITGLSDNKGCYTISLPAGKYSVFVADENQLFASIYDGEGNINPVEVKQNQLTTKDITINSRAAY